jgi:hypothetical protein
MAVRSKAWVYRSLNAGMAVSNSAGVMKVCLLCVLCVVRQSSLRRAVRLSKVVLSSVVCLIVIENLPHGGNSDPLRVVDL